MPNSVFAKQKANLHHTASELLIDLHVFLNTIQFQKIDCVSLALQQQLHQSERHRHAYSLWSMTTHAALRNLKNATSPLKYNKRNTSGKLCWEWSLKQTKCLGICYSIHNIKHVYNSY